MPLKINSQETENQTFPPRDIQLSQLGKCNSDCECVKIPSFAMLHVKLLLNGDNVLH